MNAWAKMVTVIAFEQLGKVRKLRDVRNVGQLASILGEQSINTNCVAYISRIYSETIS